MTIFITNLETIPASDKETKLYYATKTETINILLAKYHIRDSEGKLEKISAEECRSLLSLEGFFQSTPLKPIFFNQKQQFIPQEILTMFRSIISDPPLSIKSIFLTEFLTLLNKKGWDKPLSQYFEEQYHLSPGGVAILEHIEDFSFGSGIYKTTFQLQTPKIEKIVIFLKRVSVERFGNERLYFQLQKQFLSTAKAAKIPFLLVSKVTEEGLLLSPLIPGASSDIVLSKLTQFYREFEYKKHQFILKNALEILIKEFIRHAVLGDLLGRNDRHLLNSHIACLVEDVPQKNLLETLNNSEKIISFANNIVAKQENFFSLIHFDLDWLLKKENIQWMFADIDFGLSELNLLSLFPEFNDYDVKNSLFHKRRKEYVEYFFHVYCQQQKVILDKKETLFSELKKSYPSEILEEKCQTLTYILHFHEENTVLAVKLFERYLLSYRSRRIYKETLFALYEVAMKSNNKNLLNALEKANLLKYIPSHFSSSTSELSVFLQLQCFRSVLSEDLEIFYKEEKTTWETVAADISTITETFDEELFKDLQSKKQFIENDTLELLKSLRNSDASKYVSDSMPFRDSSTFSNPESHSGSLFDVESVTHKI